MERGEHTDVKSRLRVPVAKLRKETDPKIFPFETTADLEKSPNEMIGQERAVLAMDFGLAVEQSGYNLFVVGPPGTGKMTLTLDSVKKMACKMPIPDDWCYVYNFENPDHPIVLSFPAGEGLIFQRKIEELLIEIERELRSAFSSEIYEKNKRAMIEKFRSQMEERWQETDEFARIHQVKIERTPQGINTYPLLFGQPIKIEEYEQLSAENRELLREREKIVEEKIQETVREIRKLDEKLRNELDTFMKKTAAFAIEGLFHPLKEEYRNHEKILAYLDAYFHDVVTHYSYFIEDDHEQTLFSTFLDKKEQRLHRYTVNLFVNNRHLDGAPVIYEPNPTYHNLFGKIEYHGSFGSWMTDFTRIKPGDLHLANGGYLILQASELLQQPYVWSRLKRTLQMKRIQIENLHEERAAFPTTGLRPEAIPLNIKVIIIGSYQIYELLSIIDPDFSKLFKVKVEFNTFMKRTKENCLKMGRFVKNFADHEGLLPFHRRAIGKVVDYSSRLVQDQEKLSTRFQEITKVLVESSYWARKENAEYVDQKHVIRALKERIQRSNHIFEMYREMIKNGTIMVDTDGYRVGQINGLAVIGSGDTAFGIPTKITARTFVGHRGIMNIERETAMSGQIHNKGLMILIGFLSGEFASNRPIPLSASITFEQTYTPIDGDSASSTELYVLLSSLANVPINQGIAVTGSVNQWGEIQPIGGVNEKIEGFFRICKEKGLTGEQGVIIPEQNVVNLMLNDEVIEAVCNGQFHIWAIRHIAEGIEILTGIPAGAIRDEQGNYPPGTVFARVAERIEEMYESFKKEPLHKTPGS